MKGFISVVAAVSLVISSGQGGTAQDQYQGGASDLRSWLKMITRGDVRVAVTDTSRGLDRTQNPEAVTEMPGNWSEPFLAGPPVLNNGRDDSAGGNTPVFAEYFESTTSAGDRPSPVPNVDRRSASDMAVDSSLEVIGALFASLRAPAVASSPVHAVSKWSSDLDALLDERGLSGTYTVWIDRDCAISGDRVTGPGVYYRFSPGCKISGAGGPMLTIHSPANVVAKSHQQVFGSAVTIRFVESGTVHPGWWGGAGTGLADDTPTIQAAIDAIEEGTVLLARGTYVVDGLRADTGTVLKGDGDATLRLKEHATGGILSMLGSNNITVEDITFDMNGANQGNPAVPITKPGIYARQLNHLQIKNCRFINVFESAVVVYRCNYISIEGCYFAGKVEGNPMEWAVKDIHVVTCSHVTIKDCVFDHDRPADINHGVVAIFLATIDRCTVDGNVLRYSGTDNGGRHQGAAIDLYSDCRNVAVTNNVVEKYNYIGCRIQKSTDIRFENNYLDPSEDTYEDAVQVIGGLTVKPERIWIIDNILVTPHNHGRGVYVVSKDVAGGEANDVHILDNTIRGWYGIWVRRGCSTLHIMGNDITTNYCGIRCDRGAAGVLSDVIIANNDLDMSGNKTTYALGVTGVDAEVVNNTILSAYYGLSLRVASGGYIHHNMVEASSYHVLFYDETQGLYFTDNELIGTGPEFYKQGSELVYYGAMVGGN